VAVAAELRKQAVATAARRVAAKTDFFGKKRIFLTV
jgi:hypothetical protein